MPFFGNILPTLRSYGGLEYGIDGKATIGAQPSALGMNVPLSLGQWLEVLGSSPVGHAFSSSQSGEIIDKPVRAAQYVRMSTEHQKYSTENHSEAVQHYAAQRGMEIVRTYADEGKSGLSLDGRDALKQLIEDVQNKTADFSVILVYDISRWGRFQDADESAYYEYIATTVTSRSIGPLRRMYPQIVIDTIAGIKQAGGWVEQDPVTDLLTINGEFTASIVVVRCQTTPAGSRRWQIRFDVGLWPDITVAVRMDQLNRNAFDYYRLPRSDMTAPRLRLADDNGISLDAYRFETLDSLFNLAARTDLLEVA